MRATILLLALLPFLATAQHCGYCFSALIAVHAHTEGNRELVPGLRILLLDSTGLPATEAGRPYPDLGRNDERPQSWTTRQWKDHGGLRFPSAGDAYVLLVPLDLVVTGWSALVQDLPTPDRSPRYTQQVVPVQFPPCDRGCREGKHVACRLGPEHPAVINVSITLSTR